MSTSQIIVLFSLFVILKMCTSLVDLQPPASGVKHFRWDHAPLHLYYEQTRLLAYWNHFLLNCENSFACISHDAVKVLLERMYNSLVKILGDCSAATIPRCNTLTCFELGKLMPKYLISVVSVVWSSWHCTYLV